MNITRDLEFEKSIITKIAKREFGRAEGIHGTDLIFCLNKQALRKLHPEEPTAQEVLLFSLGWASQRWLSGKMEADESIERDGILVTPDTILEDGRPWELKATYQSSARPIVENVHWVRQLMAQCKVLGSTTAKLSRLEIMGCWSWVYHPKKPETIQKLIEEFGSNWDAHPTLSAYHCEFTQEEIDQNWAWLLVRRGLFVTILETRKLLPASVAVASGQFWECDKCQKLTECGFG